MRPSRLIQPLLAVALIGCHDATGIDAFAGSYGLVKVDGSLTPAMIGATIYCDVYLRDGLLTVSQGSWGMFLDVLEDCRRSGGDTATVPSAKAGAASLVGDTLVLADTDGAHLTDLKATRTNGTLNLVIPPDNVFFFATDHTLQFVPQPLVNRH